MGAPSLTTKTKTDVVFLIQDGPWVLRRSVTLGTAATAGPASDGILKKGTCLALKAADSKYYEYVNGSSGGIEVCVGFLDEETKVTAADAGGVMVYGRGNVDTSECEHYHAGVKTDLTAACFVWL